MVTFITFLRGLAACLITNAHYTGIYPTDLIANGGLLGDVIFFSVSGYCLYNVKVPFSKWYCKRILRIYPPVLIMTAIYIVVGAYKLSNHNLFWWFVYPTNYHFVASILILYVPYYFIMGNKFLRNHIVSIMLIVAVVWLLVYVCMYDRSFYHIDTVREPMIRFLFMESMLVGAWFRHNDFKIRNHFKAWYLFTTVFFFITYFVSKFLFSYRQNLAEYQILNQYILILLLIFIFMTFSSLDVKLECLPYKVKKVFEFLSKITLEIYVVQYVLIDKIRFVGHFPINWIFLTATIIISSLILHKVCEFVYSKIYKLI